MEKEDHKIFHRRFYRSILASSLAASQSWYAADCMTAGGGREKKGRTNISRGKDTDVLIISIYS